MDGRLGWMGWMYGVDGWTPRQAPRQALGQAPRQAPRRAPRWSQYKLHVLILTRNAKHENPRNTQTNFVVWNQKSKLLNWSSRFGVHVWNGWKAGMDGLDGWNGWRDPKTSSKTSSRTSSKTSSTMSSKMIPRQALCFDSDKTYKKWKTKKHTTQKLCLKTEIKVAQLKQQVWSGWVEWMEGWDGWCGCMEWMDGPQHKLQDKL